MSDHQPGKEELLEILASKMLEDPMTIVKAAADLSGQEPIEVHKAGEKSLIPEIPEQYKRAILAGLLGMNLDEASPPDETSYERLYFHEQTDLIDEQAKPIDTPHRPHLVNPPADRR